MKTRSPEIRKGPVGEKPGRRFRFRAREFVIVAALFYAVLISFLSVYKHEIYASSRFDLGNMDQAVWNSSEGRILEATDERGEITSRLKNHADFLLLAFVPLYWLHASPHWLLVTQAVVVGLGAIPLYWLARRFLKRDWPAALIAVAYLFSPGLQAANLFDFHAQMMAGTFLLFAFHYLLEKRLWPFLVFAVLASLTKEGIVLIVGMMGLYALFVEKRPRWGILVFLASSAYFLLTMLVIIPAFNTGASSGLVEERYEAFGGSIGGVIRTAITDPFFVAAYMLADGKWTYFFQLFGMTGFLGLFAPHLALIPASEISINLLSDRPQMTSVNYHYSAPILPFSYVAAAAGISTLTRFPRRRRARRFVPNPSKLAKLPIVLASGILLFGVQMDFERGPLPVFHSPANYRSVIDPAPPERTRALDEAVTLIPDDARVSATNNIGPHLAHRRYLYLFPTVKDAEYVILDETAPGYDTQIEPILNLQSTQELRQSGEYEEIFSREGVVVFERE
ncbi:MAG: DUF2079 domain-containing protein [Rubrobacteraceae bacterium]